MLRLPKFTRLRFLRDPEGSVSVEAVLIAPLLIWGMVATYVFYDGFRHKTRVQVASNTVVDVLSRRTSMVTAQDVEDLNNIFDALTTSRGTTAMRVTSVAQTVPGEDPIIAWSHGTRGIDRAETLADLTRGLPPILTGEAAIVLETFGNWTPPFPLLGMERIITSNAQVTSRPRFVPWLHFEGSVPVFDIVDPEWAFPPVEPDPPGANPQTPPFPVTPGNPFGPNGPGQGNNAG